MRRDVTAYFDAHDGNIKGDWRLVAKLACFSAVYVSTYALLLSNRFSPLEMLGLVGC